MTNSAALASHHALDDVSLRVIVTSDVHGELTGYNYFTKTPVQNGLVHAAGTIEQAKSEVEQFLLIDNGDLIQGSPLASWAISQNAPNPIIAALNELEYDLANLGNHEFNFGLERLWQTYEQARFPVISGNIENVGNSAAIPTWIKPYHMFERQVRAASGDVHPLKVAVVGVLPPQIMLWDQHHLKNKLRATNSITALHDLIPQIKAAGADIVILAAHMGMPKHSENTKDAEQALWSLAGIEGVDAIVFGHQHETFPGTDAYDQLPEVDSQLGTIRGVPAVQPGVFAEHVGVLDLQLDFNGESWSVLRHHTEVRPASSEQHHKVERLATKAHSATSAYVLQPVGFTEAPLIHRLSRLQPTLATQLIHDAQMWYSQQIDSREVQQLLQEYPLLSAAAPFYAALNARDDYTSITSGAVTLGDIGDLYRYPNTLDLVVISADQVRAWLEKSAEAFQAQTDDSKWSVIAVQIPSYNFDTLYGLKYQIDVTKPLGSRVQNITLDGKAIAAGQQFLVATNNYRASGGGDFTDLDGSQVVYRGPDQLQDILIRYLQSLPEQRYQAELVEFWEVITK